MVACIESYRLKNFNNDTMRQLLRVVALTNANLRYVDVCGNINIYRLIIIIFKHYQYSCSYCLLHAPIKKNRKRVRI